MFSRHLYIATLFAIFLSLSPAYGADATGSVDIGIVYQELEGFGASGAHYENWLVAHPLKNEIYDVIFGQLGLDIYRIRNTHEILPEYIDRTAQIIQAAELSLGHPVKIMINSGSPPAYLKSNGDTKAGTLKKDDYGNYMYTEYAQWWMASLAEYSSHGINVDYVSMQNEPDYLNVKWDTCKFTPTETEEWAGYNLAFEAFYQELNSQMPELPKLLAPETMGFGGSQEYIDALIDANHVYGFAHHLYSDGFYYNPDSFILDMQIYASKYGYKPLLQTECSGTDDHLYYIGVMALVRHMHNSLVHEGVCAYLYWDLFWGFWEGDAGGLVTIDFPWDEDPGYIINKTYYAFKQYSAFTDPGWRRVEASTDSSDLRITAFTNPDVNELSIVIINVSDAGINLTLPLKNFTPNSSGVYRTSETESTAYVGTFDELQPLLLPAESITTISLTGSPLPENCAGVQVAGFSLISDISGDCYVNYTDLDILTDYWLDENCNEPDDCQGANINEQGSVNLVDFSIFTSLWLQCNNPEDANCAPNW